MDGAGHDTNPWRDFDVLRCVECNEIIKVPKTAMEYECPHCEALNVFEMKESND